MKKFFYSIACLTLSVSLLAGCTQDSNVPLSTQVMMNILKPIVGDPKDPKNVQHVSLLLYKKDLTPELSNGVAQDMCKTYPKARIHFIDKDTKTEIASRKACS